MAGAQPSVGSPPADRRSELQCLGMAAIIWLVWFYFARNISFAGDDFSVILPVIDGGIGDFLRSKIRPLELLVAGASIRMQYPVWLLVSLLLYSLTAAATMRFVTSVSGERPAPFWAKLLCACSPLAAQAYFQIDAISQALANLFSLLLATQCLGGLRATGVRDIRRHALRVACLGVLCLVSKETTFGLVFGCCLLMLVKHGRLVMLPMAGTLVLVVAAAGVSVTGPLDTGPGAQYGVTFNPVYWLFAFVFSLVAALAPMPTSVVLSGTVLASTLSVLLLALGAAVALIALWQLLRPGFSTADAAARIRNIARGRLSVQDITVIFLLLSLVPTILVKAGELYASQALPYLKVLLITAALERHQRGKILLWCTVSACWIAASCVNLIFYSEVTGFRASAASAPRGVAESWIDDQIGLNVAHRRRPYSIYAYDLSDAPTWQGRCYVDRRFPQICLPPTISSGVPARQN